MSNLLLLLKVTNKQILPKIENDLENLCNEVNHLIDCQNNVFQRLDFLEQKRPEILNRISMLGFSANIGKTN